MLTATQTLANFAANLAYSDIPPEAVERAKACIIDTVAVASYGARFPWSRILVEHAKRYGAGGECTVLGFPGVKLNAPYAALANGGLTHAFEQDSLRQPGTGVHPGANLVPAVLAACEETGRDGKEAITAFVAACEVLFRIGAATHHSSEKLGFHAPGLTGPYGAAMAAGLVYGLNAEQLVNAMGIAGSLSSGLLAFTKAQQGAMVKRLHMGRACESGILAARLAQQGYTGPETILEGKFGFLEVYARDGDVSMLTAKLKEDWETLRICMKRYACHVTAHNPIQAMRELMAEHGFNGNQVDHLTLEVSEKVMSHHSNREPADIMQGQYSVVFCVALAMFRDPDNAASFDDEAVRNPDIRAACKAMELRVGSGLKSAWNSRLTVKLKDGRELTRSAESYKGMPSNPFTADDLRRKFMLLTTGAAEGSSEVFDHLSHLEKKNRVLVP